MKCDRCDAHTNVERHVVDDFTGYLCEECREVWDRLQNRE